MIEITKSVKQIFMEVVKSALYEYELEKAKSLPEKIYTVNAAAKLLKMSHATLSKRVKQGIIKSTPDGRITEAAINNYLKDAR